MAPSVVCDVGTEQATATSETGYDCENYYPAQTEYREAVSQSCCTDHKETFQDDPKQSVGSQTST